jgi:hypothetical protein
MNMDRRVSSRRWAIVLAIAALLALAGRCSGEVDIEPTQTLQQAPITG